MAIEIHGLPGSKAQRSGEGAQVQVPRQEPGGAEADTGRPSTADTVSLTNTAKQLHTLEKMVAQLPVVDTQRVEEIKAALDNGSFEIEPSRIAAKLMNFEQTLFG